MWGENDQNIKPMLSMTVSIWHQLQAFQRGQFWEQDYLGTSSDEKMNDAKNKAS